MMKRIILRLDEQAPDLCAWTKIEADGFMAGGRGSLAELAAGAEGYRLQVLLPGSEVLLTRVVLPPGNRKQLLAAIPYALEESLAGEVEEQHFAIGAADADGALGVAVIARERLEYWLALCREHGLEPALLTSEVLALPAGQSGRAMLAAADGLVLVRSGRQDGFVLDHDSLAIIPGLPGISPEEPFILFHEGEKVDLPAELAPLVAEHRRVPDVMALLAEGLREKEIINLRQGDYRPQAHWERHWQRWRLPAVLLLVLLLVQTGMGIRENHRLRLYEEQLSAEIIQVYRQAFPGAQRIVNPRAQMEHQLQTLRGGGGELAAEGNLLRIMERGGPLLAAMGGLELRGLRYRAGELDLEIEIADLQGLDTLKEQMAEQGLEVEIRAATTRGDRVQARLQIKEV